MRILLLENDHNCANEVAQFMNLNKINCHVETFAKNAYNLLCSAPRTFDALVVDLGLNGMNGQEFIHAVRTSPSFNDNYVPIVVLSGKTSLQDKIDSLFNGADYFLAKPYNAQELLLVVVNLVSRIKKHSSSIISVGEINLDLLRRTVSINNKDLKLTAKEYHLMEYLMLHKGNLLLKKSIIQHLYAEEIKVPTMKIADVLICKIRHKIAEFTNKEYITTCWGMGYRIDNPYLGKTDEKLMTY